MIYEAEMDKFVYTIIKECRAVTPPLSRGEIEEIAVDQIELQVKQQIAASLARLVERGLLTGEHKTGAPQRFGLMRKTAA